MKLLLMASAVMGLGVLPVWADGSSASAATSRMPAATAQRLKDEGAIPPDTRAAGASGGAIDASVSANGSASPRAASPARVLNDARTNSARETTTGALAEPSAPNAGSTAPATAPTREMVPRVDGTNDASSTVGISADGSAAGAAGARSAATVGSSAR